VKGTIHWVCAETAINLEVRLYDHLFTLADLAEAEEGKSYLDYLNPESLKINKNALGESSLREANASDQFQFLRLGYFCADKDYSPESPVFNRVTTLRDSWAKQKNKQK
jgi:glutaminyl-tRNA synthetase